MHLIQSGWGWCNSGAVLTQGDAMQCSIVTIWCNPGWIWFSLVQHSVSQSPISCAVPTSAVHFWEWTAEQRGKEIGDFDSCPISFLPWSAKPARLRTSCVHLLFWDCPKKPASALSSSGTATSWVEMSFHR